VIGEKALLRAITNVSGNHEKLENTKKKCLEKSERTKQKIIIIDFFYSATIKEDSNSTLSIARLNVEGVTTPKAEIISEIFNNADAVLVLQETRGPSDQTDRLK